MAYTVTTSSLLVLRGMTEAEDSRDAARAAAVVPADARRCVHDAVEAPTDGQRAYGVRTPPGRATPITKRDYLGNVCWRRLRGDHRQQLPGLFDQQCHLENGLDARVNTITTSSHKTDTLANIQKEQAGLHSVFVFF